MDCGTPVRIHLATESTHLSYLILGKIDQINHHFHVVQHCMLSFGWRQLWHPFKSSIARFLRCESNFG